MAVVIPYSRERALLAKLAAKTGALEVGSVSANAVRQPEVAAAMGFASRRLRSIDAHEAEISTNLLLYLWADDQTLRISLLEGLEERIAEWVKQENWRAKHKKVKRLASMALEELMSRRPCHPCEGSGKILKPGFFETRPHPDNSTRTMRIWVRGQTLLCENCSGLGAIPWSQRRRARAAGLSQSAWRETWDKRYERILSLISTLERRGLRMLRKAL